MSKKIVYTCDRCGYDTAAGVEVNDYSLPVADKVLANRVISLCKCCENELNELLRKYFINPDADCYEDAMLAPPNEVIDEWKSLLEDANHDIIELEEELERLRDVKDKLFETNFKLTAQLRALGVEVDEEDGE